MLNKYRPETAEQKKERLKAKAAEKAAGGAESQAKKPHFVKSGINHIASLVEQKKASMVLIAHDVDPIELVIWLPALCRKKDVPFCIVKGKARLGSVVHKKTATALAFTSIRKEVCLLFSQTPASCVPSNMHTFRVPLMVNAGHVRDLFVSSISISHILLHHLRIQSAHTL